jgi:hypothetical protein
LQVPRGSAHGCDRAEWLRLSVLIASLNLPATGAAGGVAAGWIFASEPRIAIYMTIRFPKKKSDIRKINSQ